MKRYLHFVTKPYSFPVIKPLLETINNYKKGESLVYVHKSILDKVPSYVSSNVTDSIYDAIKFKPDIVFIPGNIVHPNLPGIKVQVFHGLCEEKGGHYKITGFFDIYCTSGPLITSKFKRLEKKYGHFVVVETGWPKVDYILSYELDQKYREKIVGNTSMKVILYAPTFSPKFKSTSKLMPVLSSIIRDDEIVIVKFHDLAKREEINEAKKIGDNRIIVLKDADNVPLLHLADILISDTSSIVYEFLLLGKPVITIGAKVRQEKGINLKDVNLLRAAIDKLRENPDLNLEARDKIITQVQAYRDTKNSLRVIESVDKIIESGALSKLRKKPLNFFRKYQAYRFFN